MNNEANKDIAKVVIDMNHKSLQTLCVLLVSQNKLLWKNTKEKNMSDLSMHQKYAKKYRERDALRKNIFKFLIKKSAKKIFIIKLKKISIKL
jgi:hypothetical protein